MSQAPVASADTPTGAPKASEKRRSKGKVFCHCRKPAGPRFMIGCDECNEWFHGDCVQITKTRGDEIDKYYCSSCTSKNPALKIVYFAKKKSAENADPTAKISVRCTECINCLSKEDCGECYRCKDKSGRCLAVVCLIEEETQESGGDSPNEAPLREKSGNEKDGKVSSRMAGGGGVVPDAPPDTQRKRSRRKKTAKKERDTGKDTVSATDRSRSERSPLKGDEELRPGYDTTLKQRLDTASEAYAKHQGDKENRRPRGKATLCIARGCHTLAVPDSKYCSDECGMRVAKERLSSFLPRGIDHHWNSPSLAMNKAREKEQLRKQEEEANEKEKQGLDYWHELITNYVEALKQFEGPFEIHDDKGVGEFVMECCVCSVEYGSRVIAKHTKHCYSTVERKAAYGPSQESNPDGILCEGPGKDGKTHCERLRVLCADHYKGEAEAEIMVCGWPLVWAQEGSQTMEQQFTCVEDVIRDGMCCASRKDCKQHVGWITAVLGIIDHQRLEWHNRMEPNVKPVEAPPPRPLDSRTVEGCLARLAVLNVRCTVQHDFPLQPPLERLMEKWCSFAAVPKKAEEKP